MVARVEPLLHPSRHGLVVVVAAAPELAAQLAALHPAERALAAAMAPIRQREWVAGRTALREALRREALLDGEPLLRNDRGAPQLPAAAAGSISHKGSWAAALVAPRQAGCTLGVDLEDAAGPRVDISRRVLTDRELASLARFEGEARRAELALRFSLKEAIYKAIDPWVRRYVGFREVELVLDGDGDGHGAGRAELVSPKLAAELGPCALEVSWTCLPGASPEETEGAEGPPPIRHWLSTARLSR